MPPVSSLTHILAVKGKPCNVAATGFMGSQLYLKMSKYLDMATGQASFMEEWLSCLVIGLPQQL